MQINRSLSIEKDSCAFVGVGSCIPMWSPNEEVRARCLFLCSPCSAPPDAAEPTDSSPSEIPVSTPDAAERLREARRFTAGYCEG